MENQSYETLGNDPKWIRKLLFAGVFIQENKLHTIFDRYSQLSSKQWLVMAVADAFEEAPDLTTLASVMGCSRQNVKKLAVNLEKEGYVRLEKSPDDARSLCVVITEKGKAFRMVMEQMASGVHDALFCEFTEEEIMLYYKMSVKLMHGMEHLEMYFKEQEKSK